MKKMMVTSLFMLLLFLLGTAQPFQEGSIKHKDVTIAYYIYGKGETILVFNGGPGYSSAHMKDFAETMGKQYRVILFDQRGTGKSTIPTYNATYINVQSVVEDAKKLLDHLGIRQSIVMGHSFGGILAMYFSYRYPQYIRKLILGSSAGIDLGFLDYFGDNISQRLCTNNVVQNSPGGNSIAERRQSFFAALTNNAPAYLFKKENVPTLVSLLTKPDSYEPEYNSLMWQDLARINYDLSKKFSRFHAPVLVIQGRQDIVGSETAINISRAFKQVQLSFINRCGHVPWLDQPDTYFKQLQEFINKK